MLCDPAQKFTCPETACGNIKFAVCEYTYTPEASTFDKCSDTSKLNCNDPSLLTCMRLRSYVSLHGVNNTLPVGNQIAVCEVDESLPTPVIPEFPEYVPTPPVSSGTLPSATPSQSAATINNTNFILAFMFVFLLAASFARKF